MSRLFVPSLALALAAACTADSLATQPEGESEDGERHAYASGIRLTQLSVNQAVDVVLVDMVSGTELLDPAHPVPLLAGRATLVRAQYRVHAEFEPRELLAQLRVEYPDDSSAGESDPAPLDPLVRDSLVWIDGDSLESSLERSFAWYLEPGEVVDGMRVRVDVFETEPFLESALESALESGWEPDPLDAPALPWARDSVTFTADPDPMQIEVVLVPIEHHFGGCVSNAEVPTSEVEALRKELEQANPVQRAELSVRAPMIYTESIGTSANGYSTMLSQLSQLRSDDDAPPWVYYFGLVTSCDDYPVGVLGQAIAIPQAIDPGLGYQRVAVGRFSGDGQAAAETFVHEVGHTQGRYHVRCAGEIGVDPDYPHVGGVTGVWGFGIHDLRLRSPVGSRDYMTYCTNEWVSDYGYNKVWPVIEALTQWSLAQPMEDGQQPPSAWRAGAWSNADFDEILVGALYPDGSVDWWTTRGSITGTLSSQAELRWELDGELLRLPIWVSPRADDDTLNLMAVLPEGELDRARFALELAAPDLEGIEPTESVSIEFDALHRAVHRVGR